MSYIKADNKTEQMYFDYLEDLRQSGDTNMFGAGPYLQSAFGMSADESHKILGRWMDLHKEPSRCSDKPFTATKTTVKFRTVTRVTSVRRKNHDSSIRE